MAIQERKYDCRENALIAFQHVVDLTHDNTRSICHCPACLHQAEALAISYVNRLVPAIEAVGMKRYHYPTVEIIQGNARLNVPVGFIDLVSALKEDLL